jgi:hypothetical protein
MNKKSTNALQLSRKLAAGIVVSSMVLKGCSSDSGAPRIKDFEEKTIYTSTKGTVTEVEEIEPGNEYKILDERLIDDKEKSIAIIHTLKGTTDTVSLRKLESKSDTTYRRHYSPLRGLLFYSMARSFFTNNVSNVTPDSRYYKTPEAYNKSTGLKSELQSSASRRSVKVPSASSKGYGAGKSFRSFGG